MIIIASNYHNNYNINKNKQITQMKSKGKISINKEMKISIIKGRISKIIMISQF